MSDNQRWEYSDTFGKTVMQEAIEEARQAANAARQEALAVNSADSSSRQWDYSETFGKTVMKETIEQARQEARAVIQQSPVTHSAATLKETQTPNSNVSAVQDTAAAANSSEPAKPPIIYTEVKHDPVLQQKPEVKPRTKKPESAEAALARLRLEAASELPNAETEELAAVERRNKAILFASGIEPPSTKNPRELDAAVRQLTEQQTLQVLDKLRKAETVDLCFLVDVTFSMDPYISAVAKSVFQIVEEVARVHRGRPLIGKKQSFRVAFVGYRDIDPTIMREEPTEIIDFTSNVQLFRDKVNEIKACGGWDEPEDVLGGIEKALTKIHWSEEAGTRVIFHITDNPCHGYKYNSGLPDNFPQGDPFNRQPEKLFVKMREMNIQYFFGRIQSQTDKMIKQFSQLLKASIEVVNINELSLFQDKVSAVVSTSISTSITQAATITDKLELRRYEISKLEPEWTVVPIQFVDMMTYEKPESLHMIIRDRRLKTKTRMEQVKMGAEPFAEGADRIVFHGILLAPLGVQAAAAANNKRWRTSALGTHIVLKQFKQIVPNMDAEAFFYEEQAQLQAIAAYFAHEFSRVKDLHPPIQLRYIQSKICKTAHGILYSVEAELQEAKMIKFSNNGSYKLKKEQAAKYGIPVAWLDFIMTFSHWTFAKTDGEAMVVDLQGGWQVQVGEKLELLLTDPVIHCTDLVRYHFRGNLGKDGMKRFFADHDCNAFCRDLGIENKRI